MAHLDTWLVAFALTICGACDESAIEDAAAPAIPLTVSVTTAGGLDAEVSAAAWDDEELSAPTWDGTTALLTRQIASIGEAHDFRLMVGDTLVGGHVDTSRCDGLGDYVGARNEDFIAAEGNFELHNDTGPTVAWATDWTACYLTAEPDVPVVTISMPAIRQAHVEANGSPLESHRVYSSRDLELSKRGYGIAEWQLAIDAEPLRLDVNDSTIEATPGECAQAAQSLGFNSPVATVSLVLTDDGRTVRIESCNCFLANGVELQLSPLCGPTGE